MAAGVKAYTYS